MGACLPREILEFRTSEIPSAGFSGQVSVAKNNTHLQYSGSALVAIQPLPSFDHTLTGSRIDSFAHGANLRQAKVARARTRVCRGLATPLRT